MSAPVFPGLFAPALVDMAYPTFHGSDYVPVHDAVRLTGQIARIYALMQDGAWRTLQEIADTTHDPAASVSAQLRNLRKVDAGAHVIEKRARGERASGLWEYRLVR